MALIQGREVQQGPKQLPANPKLWNTITSQAGTKFSKNSPAKAHWIHARYLQLGGKFVESVKDIDPRMRDYDHEKQEKEKAAQKKSITRPSW